MKNTILALSALMAFSASAIDIPKALYVKKGETYTKYNFGVADDLKFSDQGKKLTVTGYNEVIDLEGIDYITFSAPIDNSALTPTAQKEKLSAVGKEALSKVNPRDLPDLLNALDVLLNGYRDADGKRHRALIEFSFPDDFLETKDAAKKMLTGFQRLAQGNPSGARTAKAGEVDLYKASDYFGVFTANEKEREWQKTSDADYFELRFNAKDGSICRIRLETSNDFLSWTTKDFEIQVPNQTVVTFYKDDNVLAKSTLDSKVYTDTSIDLYLKFEAGEYVVNNAFLATNDKIEDSVAVVIKGEEICNAKSVIEGKNLVTYDVMYDDIKEATHYHDEDGNCVGEDTAPIAAHFIRATANADILGKLQISGKIFNFSKLNSILSEEDEEDSRWVKDGYYIWAPRILSVNDDKTIIDRYYDSRDYLDNQVKYMNDFTDIYFSYDNNGKRQGFITWNIDDDIEEYEDYNGDEWGQYGYVIRDNYLINVSKHKQYDDEKGDYYWGPWHFEMYPANYDDDEWDEEKYRPITVEVDASEVIQPTLMRNHYYEIAPLLVFPDLTSFMFEDFFDEDSFESLINDYDDIIDTYLSVTGQDD